MKIFLDREDFSGTHVAIEDRCFVSVQAANFQNRREKRVETVVPRINHKPRRTK